MHVFVRVCVCVVEEWVGVDSWYPPLSVEVAHKLS